MSAQLRPFTKQDWQAFSGCESDSPEIAELTGTFDGVLILDGETVQVIENDQAASFYTKDCSSPSCARLVALAILSSEQPVILAAELLDEVS